LALVAIIGFCKYSNIKLCNAVYGKKQPILDKASVLVGTIPKNISNLTINLSSNEDIDIQLFAEDGTAIVSWNPKGLLDGATHQTINFHGMNIEWSGYAGVNDQRGHEYIKVDKASEKLTMKVYGYAAGEADVTYTWGEDTSTGVIPTTIDDAIAVNFLSHATFGANTLSIEELKNLGIESWLDQQLNLPYVPRVHIKRLIKNLKKTSPNAYPATVAEYLKNNDIILNKNKNIKGLTRYQMSEWFETVLTDKDQLRHKVAYALSQIIVEGLGDGVFVRRPEALSMYFDTLTKHAFGNYRDLLIEISHSASMSSYLTYGGNKKAYTRGTTTIYPDENYARELMQLFTIGLSKLNLDGSEILDEEGNTVPTYTQDDVNEIARIFTGWDLKHNSKYGRASSKEGDFTQPLEFTGRYHDFEAKHVLGTDIEAGNTGSEDISALINILMSHPNIGPFISKQLIMRLVKSNPTPAYVARVSSVFNNNGKGIKGDLKAVIKAIFLDPEIWKDTTVKKFKEPLVAYTQFLRAFNAKPLPIWKIKKTSSTKVKNSFLFGNPTEYLGQGASRSSSVFNFYSNTFIPNNNYFKNNNLVAPEIQIQTDKVIIKFNNQIYSDLLSLDKTHMKQKYGTIDDLAILMKNKFQPAYDIRRNKFLLDCKDEYGVIKSVLYDNATQTFKSFNGVAHHKNDKTADKNGFTKRDRAIKALISHLDMKLTSGTLTEFTKTTLFKSYKNVFYNTELSNANNPALRIYEDIIVPIIVAIVTSSANMIH